MKKIIIAGAALAAISVFTVSAFAADTSNETSTSAPFVANTTSSQCTQEYCPQDGTGNRYGAENENENGISGVCNSSCPQDGTGNRYGAENQNGNSSNGVYNSSRPQDGTGNRYGADNGNKNTNEKNGICKGCKGETCTNLCSGSQQRLRLYSEK